MPDSEKKRLFHFWTDVETTGLKVDCDAVLEISWMLTDANLKMVSPLRQRFTNLTPPANAGARLKPDSGHMCLRFIPGKAGCWTHLDPKVMQMHQDSGLREAWEESGELARLNHPQDVIRLILDDLVAVGFTVGVDKLVLSGAGVSHFENRLLPLHFPGLFDLPLWEYWTLDSSTGARLLGPGMMSWLRKRGLDSPSSPWSIVEVENDVDDSLVHLIGNSDAGTVFLPSTIVKHRAADDVVAALLDARLMRNAEELI